MPKTAIDPFFATNNEPLSAARNGAAVTPSDTADLAQVTSALLVNIGTGGTGITVLFANAALDAQATFLPLPPGSYRLNVQVRRVMATGTSLGTGGAIVALSS